MEHPPGDEGDPLKEMGNHPGRRGTCLKWGPARSLGECEPHSKHRAPDCPSLGSRSPESSLPWDWEVTGHPVPTAGSPHTLGEEPPQAQAVLTALGLEGCASSPTGQQGHWLRG